MNMNPSMCGQNPVFIPTADPCTNCEYLEKELRQAIKDMQDEIDEFEEEVRGLLENIGTDLGSVQQTADNAYERADNAYELAQNAYELAQNAIEIIEVYPLSGSTELSSSWLSETSGGSPITPQSGKIYILLANSTNYSKDTLFRWNGSAYEELSASQGGGGSTYTTATVNLTTGGWVSDNQTVTVQGVTASNVVIVSPNSSRTDANAYARYGIMCTAQGANSLTFSASSTPQEAIAVNVLIIE